MDGVDFFMIVLVLAAELWEQLFSKQCNSSSETLSQLLIFEGVVHRALDFVDQRSRHGDD